MIWVLFAITIISSLSQIYFIKEAEHNKEIVTGLLYIIAEGNKLNKLRHELVTTGHINLEDYLYENGNITD